MNIDNNLEGKYIYNSTTYYLNYSEIEIEFQAPTRPFNESDNGDRYRVSKYKQAEARFYINLYKEADVEAARNQYNAILGEDVTLYPWKNGDYIHDEWGDPAYFCLVNANFHFMKTTDFQDLLILTFKSRENVAMSYEDWTGYGSKFATKYGERL